ncbi:MAG: RNA polymerase sigma factor [Myxococcaceae bacterium]|nr:RNA polymerase sigma factor [Myxococcaceae bacterium]
MSAAAQPFEGLLRALAPRVVGALVRRYGRIDAAEDATQLALLAAVEQWPRDGVPAEPAGWLIRTASHRMTDLLRADRARRDREQEVARWVPVETRTAPAADDPAREPDDTLTLLFMCCHPALSPASQIALTLRAVGGLTTAQLARAFLVPEDTMTRRITRAKETLVESGATFTLPDPAQLDVRLDAVLHALYLAFNEGYAATGGAALHSAELSGEAIRLTRLLHERLEGRPEVAGLLALMLLTDARRPARTGPDGALVPMEEQDRSKWSRALIDEGIALVSAALPKGHVGPYQLQAAIAAVHAEAATAAATDWPQIVALYELLLQVSPNPMVALNHAVAVAMARGPAEGLARVEALAGEKQLRDDHRLHAVRAHLLERLGQLDAASAEYRTAAGLTASMPMQRYLNGKASKLEVRKKGSASI